ncbi:MAG: DUF11 domain-containing protein [Anaerolineae bacterium]|nr:DUF11 domain-containing protein [Anaerolineae bacterium]
MHQHKLSGFVAIFDIVISTLIVGIVSIQMSPAEPSFAMEFTSKSASAINLLDNDENSIGTAAATSCDDLYFYNQTKNVGSAGSQKIANTTAPTAGSPATVSRTLALLGTTNEEITRFYSDPALTADLIVSGDIVASIWLQTTDYNNTTFSVEVLDYNPSNGQTTSLGDVEFGFINTGQNEALLNITPSPGTIIPSGHRVLVILYARSPLLTTPTVTVFYDSSNRDSQFTLCQLTAPALSISKSGPVAAVAGQSINYTLTITNSGGQTANNLSVSDTLPAGANYVSGGTKVGNTVTWSIASLAPESTIQRSFTVTSSATITNSAYQVAADGGILAIGDQAVVTSVSPPGQPNLTISKSGPSEAEVGQQVTYTLSVFNGGDTAASNLTVNDTIPTGAHYVSGGLRSGNTVSWNRASLPVNTTAEFSYVVTASDTITNHIYNVTAAGNIEAIGQKIVVTDILAEGATKYPTYFPLIINPKLTTQLIIESVNTGGVNVRILDPDDNSELLSCVIDNNVTQTCGTFSSIGAYKIIASTNKCGVLQGTFNDAAPQATITRRIFCN